MKNSIPIALLLSTIFIACSKPGFEVTPDYHIKKGNVEFSTDLVLLFNEQESGFKLRPAGIAGLRYIATWEAAVGKPDILKQVERDDSQYGDGRDDRILDKQNINLTPNLFRAGRSLVLKAESMSKSNDTTFIHYENNDYGETIGKVYTETEQICFEVVFTPAKDGYFSIGFTHAPAFSIEEVDELWQPLIWRGKRMPDMPYLTLAFRCPLPTALATCQGITYGIVAHPDEFSFSPLPLQSNSRFGVAIRNAEGKVQPQLYAPVMGGVESKRSKGDVFNFRVVLYSQDKNCTDAYEHIARSLFNFHDYRKNDISTLNNTLENMIDYSLTEYAGFIDSLKGCGYDTDIPGAVKNVSALHPLELALVTDNEEMLIKRAYPMMEYMLSREKFCFYDKKRKLYVRQTPSRNLFGPTAPISELVVLYNIFGKNMPFLMELAKDEYDSSRVRNGSRLEEGDTWFNAIFMYKGSGDTEYLQKAKKEADEYIEKRVSTPFTTFLELYELTKKERYLEAATREARLFTMHCYMCPKIPDDSITVNKGGKAPLYWWTNKERGYKQMYCPEEKAPAWRLSEIGLLQQALGDDGGRKALFSSANFAPWMLRLGYYANDQFLREVAKAAIIGRYRNYPGHHINTARTTVYEKADYPLRPHEELSVSSFHYNHILPMASLLLDYLVTDAYVKSGGSIDFPSEFIEGYGLMRNKFYGHEEGNWYGEKVWLWMPPRLIESGSIELNYISARGKNALYVALSNQSGKRIKTWIRVNKDLVRLSPQTMIMDQDGKVLKIKSEKIELTVPPHGQIALAIKNVSLVNLLNIQDRLLAKGPEWKNSYVKIKTGNARAMIISMGDMVQNLFLYLRDDNKIYNEVLLTIKGTDGNQVLTDKSFPFEFTVPVEKEITFKLSCKKLNGSIIDSEWVTMN